MDSNDKLNVGAWDLSSFKNQSGTEYNYSNGSTDYNEFSSIKGVLDMSHNKSPQASRLQHNNFTSAASGKPSSSRPPKLPNPSLPQFSNAFSSEQHHHPLHYSQKSQNLSFNNNSKNNENASHLKNSSVIKDPFSKYAVSEPSGILPPRASSLNQGFHLDNLLNQASTRPSNLSISPSSQQSSNHRTNNSRPSSISNHQSLHQQNSSQQQQQNSSQQHQQKLSHQQQQNSSQQQNKHNSFHQPQNDSSHQASIPYARSDAAIDSNLFNSKVNNSNNNNNSGDITLKSADEVFEVYSISDEDEVEEGIANIAASNCHTNKHKSNHCNNNSSNSTDSNKHNNADKKEERSFGMLSENKAFDDCDSSLCPINGTGHLDHTSHDVNFNSHNDVEEDVKEMKSRDEGEEVIEVDMGYINGYRVNKMDDNYDMSNRGDGEGVEVDDGGVEESGGGGDGLKESVVVMEDILIMNEDIIIDHAKAKKSNKTKKVHSSKVNNSNNNIDAGAEDNDNNRESVVKNGVEEEGEKVEELRTRSTRKRRRKVFMGERGDDDDDDLDDGDDDDDDQMVKVKRMSMMMHADEGGRSGEKGKEKGVSKGSRRGRGRGTKRGTTRNTQGRFDNDPDKSHDWKKQSYKEDVSSRRTRGNNDNDEDDEDDDGTKKMKKKKTLTISECINNSSGASGSRLQMVEYQWPEGQEWWVLEEPVTQLLGFKLRSRYSNISRRVISNPDELSFLSHHGCIDPLDDDVANNNNNNNKNNNNSNNNSSNNKNNNSTKNSCDKARGEVAQSVSSGSLKKEEAAKALKKNKSKYTSVLSMEEVVDVLSKHYPAKYQEYTRGSRKQLKGVVKASSTASTATATATTSSTTASIAATTTTTTSTTSNSSRYENLLRKSIKSAASFNSMLSKERLTERQSYFDLQTFEVHQASRRQPRGAVFSNRLLCESYPVALVPGQFQEGFKHYSPVELNYFPLNTALFAPPKHFDTFTSPEEPIVNLCADEHDNDLEEEEEEEDPLAATTAASGSTSSTKVEVKGMGGVVAGGSVAASHSFSGEDSTTSVLSVKKVRRGGPGRGKKHPMSVTARCSMCGQGWLNKYQEQDQLVRCCSCHFFNHTACLGLHPDMVDIIRTYKWQCMECKVCSKCAEPHDEDKMVFCDRCDRGYHTYCEGLSSIPEGRWECRLCTTNPPLPPTTSSNPPITPAKPKRGRPYKYPRNEHNVIITPVLNKHSSTAHNNNFNKNYNITNTPTNIYSKTLPTNHSFTPANKNNTNFNNNNKFSNNINISNIKNSNNNNNNTATSKFVMKEEEEEEEEEENEDDMSLALTCENDTLDSNNDDSDAKRGRIEDFKSNYVTYNNNNNDKNKNTSNNGSTSNKNSNNNGSSNDRTMDVGVNHKNTTFITNQNTNIANTITAITATTSITTTTNTTINISNIKNNSNINTNNKHQ